MIQTHSNQIPLASLASLAQLNQFGNVGWHLLNLSIVVLFDLLQHGNVLLGDEIDGNTLATETAGTTNAMQVVGLVDGEVVVDDDGNLLDIDTTSEQVSSDEDTRRAGTEGLHNCVTFLLGHFTVHRGDSEISLLHLLSQNIDLAASVAEDDGLSDAQGIVQIAQGVELVFLLVNVNVELLDTFQGQLVTLDKDADGIAHKVVGDFQNLSLQSGRDEDDLDGGREALEDVVDLILETAAEHFIGLVEDKHFHASSAQVAAVDHVIDTTGRSNDNLDSRLEAFNVLADVGASNAGVAADAKLVAQGVNDTLDLLSKFTSGRKNQRLAFLASVVNLLQNTNGKGGSLTST